MYFFKNTAGNWVLGSETTSFTSKIPCTLRRDTPTVVTVMTIEKIPVLLIDKTEVTAIKKNAEGDFYANYAEFVAAVSDFFDNAPITAEEVDAKIGAGVDILSDRIDTVEGIANAASSGSLGSIKPTDAAPTPERNGNYTFSIGGNKPAWLTAEAGITTVKAGDGVSVVYTAPSSYTYTHVDIEGVSETAVNEINRLLNSVPILTNYSILSLFVSNYAYYGDTGAYTYRANWNSILIKIADVTLPIIGNKLYLKASECKPNNFVTYNSSTIFNSTTKISNVEPVPLVDGFYEIAIPANCVAIGVNFKNLGNSYSALNLYSKSLSVGLISKVDEIAVVLNSVPILTNYSILSLFVSNYAYYDTTGEYGGAPNWKSILIKIADVTLPIIGNKLYLKASECKPTNLIFYTSSTVFNSTTKISNVEPVPLADGFYEITIPANCLSIAVNFKNTENSYLALHLYNAKSESIEEIGLISRVDEIEANVLENTNNIDEIAAVLNDIGVSLPPVSINSSMLKGRQIWASNPEVLVYEENGSGMLVNMFFAGDFTNMPLTEIRVEADGVISLSGTIYELIGFMLHNQDMNRVSTQLFGKNGSQNGIFMNYKIPFSTNIKVYLKKEASVVNPQFWFSTKTVSMKKISISGINIPSTAKLKCYNLQTQLNAGEYHEVFNTTKNGAVLGVFFKGVPVSGTSESYLEACVRAFVGSSTTPVKISSGLEDYFLGTYYFNTGTYYNDNAGMTKRASGQISAFRLHVNDPWFFNDGGYKVNIRCGETEDGSDGNTLYESPQPTIYKTIALVYEWD